jgi:T5SS/PEP-CTERM-associated repeat protein
VDSNINTGANWVGDVGPLPADDGIFAGTVRTSVGVPGFFSLRSLTFNNTAGVFSFTGAGSINIGVGGITNNDADAMTFGVLTNFTGNSSINATSGALTFSNTVGLGANTVTRTGGSAISMTGAVTGTGTLQKTGTGALTLGLLGTSAFDLVLDAGATSTSADGLADSFSSTGSVAVNGTATLTLNENFTLDGGTLTRASGASVTIAAGRTLTLQGGADATFTGGYANGTASTVVVTGAGSTLATSGGTLSFSSGGALNVAAGGAVSSSSTLNIGTLAAGGTATVDGAGSSITAAGNLQLALSGGTGSLTLSNNATGTFSSINVANSGTAGSNGTLSIQSGAAVTGVSLVVASTAASTSGSVTINGGGSSLTVSGTGTAIIGATSASTANFNVQSGGTFNSGTGTTTVGATGVVSISGGNFNANGNIVVNGSITKTASGVFSLASGRTMTLQSGGDASFAVTGVQSFTGSNVAVTGTGSTFTSTDTGEVILDSGANFSVQAGGSASFGVLGGGGGLRIGNAGIATASVDGTGSSLTAHAITVQCTGASSLTVSNNAVVNVGNFSITSASGTSNSASISSGADLNVFGDLVVGNASSNASLTLNGGGSSISTQNAIVTSAGTVTIDSGGTFVASGSLILNGGRLIVNGASNFQQSAGTITVQSGGEATFSAIPIFASSAAVVVSGPGSTLRGSAIPLGFGNSSLSIVGGGTVTGDGGLDIGVGVSTVVTVAGSGSSLNAGSSSICNWGGVGAAPVFTFSGGGGAGNFGIVNLGFHGNTTNATLNLQSGASVTLAGIRIADTTESTRATANIGGTNSVLFVGSSDLSVGSASGSTGVLNITGGGTVTVGAAAGNQLILNPTGTVNLDGGTLSLGNSIVRSGGLLNFNSGHLSLGESLAIGSGGLLGGNYTLDASKRLTVGPSLTTTVDAFNTLTLNGGTLSTGALVNNGTLDFQRGTLAITGASGFTIGGGALGATVTLGTGANLSVTNSTIINAGALLRTNGGGVSGSSITNNGTIDHRDGSFAFTGTLNNNASARIFVGGIVSAVGNINNIGCITLQNGIGEISGGGNITNSGTITGDGTIGRIVNNAAGGVIRAEAGKTLYFSSTFFGTNQGTLSLEGGTLDIAAPVTNHSTGFISGRGALNTNGLTNNGVMAFSGGVTDIRGDVTNASGARIVTSGAASTTTFFDDVVHNGTEIYTGAGASTVFFGSQSGAGAFTGTGTVYYNGDLRPGNSPATVNYGGNVVLAPGTELTLEIGGVSEGTQYDSLQVANALTVDGILTLMLINGFAPTLGNVFDLIDAASINGTFDTVNLPTLAQYLAWNTSNLYTTGEVSVNSTLTPIQQWRLLNFSDPSNSGDGADNNDFDKDGIANLMEYALGMDPRIPSAAGLPTLGVVTVGANQHAALTVVRPLGATDVNYRFEVTADLLGFDAGSVYGPVGDVPSNAFTTEVSRTINGSVETIVVRDNTPLSGSAKRFLRLKVTNPAP